MALLTDAQLPRAVERCLHDLQYARNYVSAVDAIAAEIRWEPYFYSGGPDLLVLTKNAMFSDMITRCLRVLDPRESAGFSAIVDLLRRKGSPLPDLRLLDAFTMKMKVVRDKIHFHRDPAYLYPERAWREAAVTGNELVAALDTAISVLESSCKDLTVAGPADFSIQQVAPMVDACRKLAR